MTPESMAHKAGEALQHGTRVTFIRAYGDKMPPGFPRGELLCENPRDLSRAYSYDPLRVLDWMHANGLATMSTKVAE